MSVASNSSTMTCWHTASRRSMMTKDIVVEKRTLRREVVMMESCC